MKFIHAADIHLDSPMVGLERYDGAPVEEVRTATRRALQNLVELAVGEAVDFVLIAGDLYDGDWKDYNTGLFFLSQMASLREAGIRVVIIAGNHDAASQITKSLRLPENVRMLSTQKPESFIMENISAVIHGQGFSSRNTCSNLAESYPKALAGLLNIGFLHTCLNGREGHEPYAPCSLEDLISRGYDYWALGHVHKRELILRSPWVVFPGNTQGRNIREGGEKGCMLISAEDGVVTNVEFRSLDVFRWSSLDLDITDITDLDDIFERTFKAIKKTTRDSTLPMAVRVRLCGSSGLQGKILYHEEYIKSGIRGCAVDAGNGNLWVEKVCIKASSISDPEIIMARGDALGKLLRSINEIRYDEEVIKEISEEFLDLFRKLPHEYQNDSEAVHPDRKDTLQSALEDVRHMLFTKILSSGGDK